MITITEEIRYLSADPMRQTRITSVAGVILATAVKMGLIERKACEECGTEDAEAHHEDYTRPLLVRWLCRQHHRARHSTSDIASEWEQRAGALSGNIRAIFLRVTEQEHAAFTMAAEADNRSLSSWVRNALYIAHQAYMAQKVQ